MGKIFVIYTLGRGLILWVYKELKKNYNPTHRIPINKWVSKRNSYFFKRSTNSQTTKNSKQF